MCAKKFLGICVKHKMKEERMDLKDEAIRNKLIDMGFILKVRDKP